jgi:hypothetical protein
MSTVQDQSVAPGNGEPVETAVLPPATEPISARTSGPQRLFPTAYVLSLGYSEAVFITTCGACPSALSRRHLAYVGIVLLSKARDRGVSIPVF